MTTYVFDASGALPANLISNEEHVISTINGTEHNYIVPTQAPFFDTSLVVVDVTTGDILIENIDYHIGYRFQEAIDEVALPISGAIVFEDVNRTGTYALRYQTLGGDFVNNMTQNIPDGLETLANMQNTLWDAIADIPATFPATPHNHSVTDIDAVNEILDELILMRQAIEDPFKDLHMRDIIDLKSEYVTPLLAGLNDIAAAIVANAATSSTYFEQSTPGNVDTALGALAAGMWTDTPLVLQVSKNGSYEIKHDVEVRLVGASGDYYLEKRYVVNDLAINRSYSNGGVIGLTATDVVTMQVRLVGSSATSANLAGPTFSSVLRATRLSS